MAKTPYHTIGTRTTPQSEPIPGTIPNSAGGHSFGVDDWTRMQRFLILGSEGGSYYASEQKLTKQNAAVVQRCLTEDGVRAVDLIVEISTAGRNPKQQPLIFAYAAACGHDNPDVRAYALSFLEQVCRTGTHLFMFASFIEQFRGWGEGLQKAIARWYVNKDLDSLMYQVVKYQRRESWSHRDLLRLVKPGARNRPGFTKGSLESAVLAWAVGKRMPNQPPYLTAIDNIGEGGDVVDVIEQYRLPWEAVPSEALKRPDVWHAMLPHMGLGALVRNLGRLSANGTLVPMTGVEGLIVSRLTNEANIKASRIHPLAVLNAAVVYEQGHGQRGSLTWQPSDRVVEALTQTFRLAFGNVVPAEKRTLLALDVSGSMSWQTIANTMLTPRVASAAMALVTVATEPLCHTMAFSHELVPVSLTKGMSLKQVQHKLDGISMGGTDCSLPMIYATQRKIPVDTFVVYTDSETWAGRSHPVQALKTYRQAMGIPAKLIVVGMVANKFSIADPNDKGMLDVVGFDTAAPGVMADFSAGRV